MVSCNKRKSQFLLPGKVDGKLAPSFNALLLSRLFDTPLAPKSTLLLDNDSNMAGFKWHEPATGPSAYFYKLYAPRRGSLVLTRPAMAC